MLGSYTRVFTVLRLDNYVLLTSQYIFSHLQIALVAEFM